MNITYGAFKTFKNKNLKGVKISTEPAETLPECVQKCEDHKNCQSANFKTKQCDLLSDNKHVSKEKLKNLTGSTHVAKMNRGCDEKKCQNNATCVPDYEQNTYSCNCKPEYSGKFCEVMLQSPTPDWWFKFDGGTENYGLNPNDASLIPVNTDNDKATFHGQPHRKGKYMKCHLRCTRSTISWPTWSNPKHGDMSLAFWVKFPRGNLVHQKSYAGAVNIVASKNKGFKVLYWKPSSTWLFEVRLSGVSIYPPAIRFPLEETKNWNFIAMSWRNGTCSGFVNDIEVTGSNKATFTPVQADILQLFHPYEASIYNIDEFRVWYHAKSPEFMKQLYNNEKIDMWD